MEELENKLEEQGLNQKEIKITKLVCKGLSNKEISKNLLINEDETQPSLDSIYKKMGLKSRAQLIVWCLPHMNF